MLDRVRSKNNFFSGTLESAGFGYHEISGFEAGIKKDIKFAGEKVPLFEELLTLVKNRPDIELNVELKDYPADIGDLAYKRAAAQGVSPL